VLLVIGAVVLGVLLGTAFGGSIRTLSEVHFRWWPLALVGFALQLIPIPSLEGRLDHWLSVGLLVASYLVLLVFVAANFRIAGFPLVAAGFALNVLVISINGGMPVSDRALRSAYGTGYGASLRELQLHGGAKHHLQRPDDDLMPLADVIPIGAPIRKVFSMGDLVSMLGITWVIAGATRGPGGKHRVGAAAARREQPGALEWQESPSPPAPPLAPHPPRSPQP
jgi:hypothetical protein